MLDVNHTSFDSSANGCIRKIKVFVIGRQVYPGRLLPVQTKVQPFTSFY